MRGANAPAVEPPDLRQARASGGRRRQRLQARGFFAQIVEHKGLGAPHGLKPSLEVPMNRVERATTGLGHPIGEEALDMLDRVAAGIFERGWRCTNLA